MGFAIDGRVYQTYRKKSDDPMQWPFNKPFYIILNMAVGGDWGGLKGIDKDAFRGTGQFKSQRVALAVMLAAISVLPEVETATQPNRKVIMRSAQLSDGLGDCCYLRLSLNSFGLDPTSQTGKYRKALENRRHATTYDGG